MMNKEKLKAMAAELAKGIKTEADLDQFTRMLTRITVEAALNAELTDHLGHEKTPRKRAATAAMVTPQKRCSATTVSLKCTRPVIVKALLSALIKKHQTRIAKMDSRILSLYAKGMTTREIAATFKEMYDQREVRCGCFTGTDTESHRCGARAGDRMAEPPRPLNGLYPVIYPGCIVVKVRQDGSVISKSVFLAPGINTEVTKHFWACGWQKMREQSSG